jgi:hypothetical protein
MKRDMDLIREILLYAEESPAGTPWSARPLLDHDLKEVIEHVMLLKDAGYVDATTLQHSAAMIRRITHDGHEFLNTSRDKTLWEKAKEQAKNLGAPITIATVKTLLDQLISARLHLPK